MGILIQARNVAYQYEDGTHALRGVDLDVAEGETLILFGANGSGKTTFLLHLNGLLQGEGRITVCGLPVQPDNLKAIRNKLGFVFQDADDQLFLPSVADDVAFGLLNHGVPPGPARERARQALATVGLAHADNKAPYHLSGGEKRRAAIAGVIAMQPDVLVLDEPTTSLDPPGQRTLALLLNRLPQAKLVSTHDTAFARAVGTRAVFFQEGKIVAAGEVDRVIREFNWDSKEGGLPSGRRI